MEEFKLRDFEITYAIEKDLQVKKFAVGNELADLLNEKLKLQNYCETVTSLFVIFQCFDPKNEYVKPKVYQRYRRKTKVIELYLTVDYAKAKKAIKRTMLRLFCESYLSGIQSILKRKDFDKKQFYTVVESLFIPYLPKKKLVVKNDIE